MLMNGCAVAEKLAIARAARSVPLGARPSMALSRDTVRGAGCRGLLVRSAGRPGRRAAGVPWPAARR